MKTKLISSTLVLLLCLFAFQAKATILWMGGEDIDFPNGAQVCSSNNASYFRSAYARAVIYTCTNLAVALSNAFPSGAVTSAWLSARIFDNNNGSMGWVGLGKSGSLNSLWIGNSAFDTQLALYTYNGTTWTKIATEPGASLNFSGPIKVDMQVINYGAAGTVNIFLNGSQTPLLTYSGNIAVGGATNLDCVTLSGENGNSTSEIIVSSTDTRAVSLATLAPSAAGDTNQWTGTFSNINPVTINDAVNVTDNTSGDTFEAKVTALPAGNFGVAGIKIAARGTKGASGLTSISVGTKTNGTVNAPAAVAQSASWATNETFYFINPVTTTNWLTSDFSNIQINLTSAP